MDANPGNLFEVGLHNEVQQKPVTSLNLNIIMC